MLQSVMFSKTRSPAAPAFTIAAAGAATILGAYIFEYGFRLLPCPLCLQQRVPYYVAIPIAVLVGLAARGAAPRRWVGLGFAAVALIMLVGVALGIYHAGVEWKWWPGPLDCSTPMSSLGSGGGLLQQLQKVTVVRCDEAPWRFLGLSLAGYNVLISAALVCLALWGVTLTRRSA